MNVYWTEAALADLAAARTYIARHSPRYADALTQRIIDRTDSLSRHSLIGAVVPEYDDEETLRELWENPYRIIYRVLPEQIDVIAIIHGARTMPPYLPGVEE